MPLSEGFMQKVRGGRRLPKYEDDAIAWNAAWEELAAMQSPIVLKSASGASARRFGEPTESIFEIYRGYFRYLCNLQYSLTGEVTQHVAAGFEVRWRAATATVRRDHIVEGHIRAAIMGFEDYRGSCGDISLESLEKNNGEGFLKLLRVYLHDDLSCVPTTPITLPYKGTSGIPMPTDENVWRSIIDLCRDIYICSLLDFTLDSWTGRPRPIPGPMGKTSFSGPLDIPLLKIAKPALGVSGVKEVKRELRSGYAAAVRCCDSCGTPETTTKHMQCKSCAEVPNRRTSYCSKQCQRDDWPRHKQYCGKKMTLETARNTAIAPQRNVTRNLNVTEIQIGPTVGGYKRSPALVAQVHRLNIHPDVDYFLATSSGGFVPLSLMEDPPRQRALRSIRDKAVTTGDRSAAAALGEILMIVAVNLTVPGVQLSQESVKEQLVLEYGEGIKKDISILMLHFLSSETKMTQYERHVAGLEIYDVSVLAEGSTQLSGM